MGSQKTLTNERYIYNCKEFQIYKTKKGVKLIKINNSFVNINNVPSINTKINEKNHNDMVAENISELNNLDIEEGCGDSGYGETIGIASVISVSSETAETVAGADAGADGAELSESSIDGEEYVLL
jgi:hypothetical protein